MQEGEAAAGQQGRRGASRQGPARSSTNVQERGVEHEFNPSCVLCLGQTGKGHNSPLFCSLMLSIIYKVCFCVEKWQKIKVQTKECH